MIRAMMIEDYEGVYKLWKQIKGFGIRSIDDSREGLERFLRRNPTTSIVAEEEGEIVGSILCGHDGRRGCFYHVCVAEEHRMERNRDTDGKDGDGCAESREDQSGLPDCIYGQSGWESVLGTKRMEAERRLKLL